MLPMFSEARMRSSVARRFNRAISISSRSVQQAPSASSSIPSTREASSASAAMMLVRPPPPLNGKRWIAMSRSRAVNERSSEMEYCPTMNGSSVRPALSASSSPGAQVQQPDSSYRDVSACDVIADLGSFRIFSSIGGHFIELNESHTRIPLEMSSVYA